MPKDFDRILTLREVMELVKLSRSQIWRLEKAGRFPQRVQLSDHRVGWRESEILEWIRSLPAAAGAA